MGLKAIEAPYLLLCEGMHDAQFFKHLALSRGLPSHFQIASCGFISGVPGHRDGIAHLTSALNALPGLPRFERLEGVLIAADNDSDADESFAHVQRLIDHSAEISPGKRYRTPSVPLQKAGSHPAVVVMMIPWTRVLGALDTLCHRSASAKRPTIGLAVDALASASGVNEANGWSITKQHKMKLRSLIAAAYVKDPYLSPTWLWEENTDLVPLDASVFDQIAGFLENFPGFMATP